MPPKVAGQDTACRVVERASLTLRRSKTRLNCQSPSDKGSLDRITCPHRTRSRAAAVVLALAFHLGFGLIGAAAMKSAPDLGR